jgi:hypothetical protein
MTANDKLEAKIAALTTEQLVEIAIRMNLATTAEEIIVCNRVDRELAKRMTEAELVAHYEVLETMLDAAA